MIRTTPNMTGKAPKVFRVNYNWPVTRPRLCQQAGPQDAFDAIASPSYPQTPAGVIGVPGVN